MELKWAKKQKKITLKMHSKQNYILRLKMFENVEYLRAMLKETGLSLTALDMATKNARKKLK